MLEQVVTSLNLSVDCLSGLLTIRRFAWDEYSGYLGLHDSHVSQPLVEALNNAHRCLELLLADLGRAHFKQIFLLDHIVQDTEQLCLIEEFRETYSHTIVLLKHKLYLFRAHHVNRTVQRISLFLYELFAAI